MTIAAPIVRPRSLAALMLDVAERATLLCLFLHLVLTSYAAILQTGHWFTWLLVLSEGLSVVFIMIRAPAREVSENPSDWTIAFFATAGPLLVHPAGLRQVIPLWAGLSLMLVGLICQCAAKLALNRSFGLVPANRGVKTGGPYRYVRHPIYLGYLCVQVGFVLLTPSVWNFTVYGLSFLCQVVRILAEERLLTQDPGYRAFQAKVRYRLIPGVF